MEKGDILCVLEQAEELIDVSQYQDHITLYPSTDKRNVAISANRRQVRYEHHLDANTKASAVLGSLVITSGEHYWEVDVSEKQKMTNAS
ncbi:tripartite motif-containing protein 5-like isoform X2 [Phyllostomus hastatus]|uniref:tripartite motif-containing protein 5-like isoform X2 n=1 Tax=Phyllostomus hastatus TaxID=9423 RepID=UPI001E67F94B|nr:tripartite motif-containing protein 5-like isoform X2 [Phyllostomus hastatus]